MSEIVTIKMSIAISGFTALRGYALKGFLTIPDIHTVRRPAVFERDVPPSAHLSTSAVCLHSVDGSKHDSRQGRTADDMGQDDHAFVEHRRLRDGALSQHAAVRLGAMAAVYETFIAMVAWTSTAA
ncbi:hypothetical protein PsYK624_003830 [Phanerochaete sordida]|uniref:Uncharacterized protein n=1 Tax=Phanerochaete sordida TaxID=48140 RepID=A0A9P3FWC7_9APHY|nr:hypothetical protein PsYK624_003830 [Phanerochaete sordida]